MTSQRIQLVVLDDDPTGIQTVHGCYLLTRWDVPLLRRALQDRYRFFYVLTNTRAYAPPKARRIVASVVESVLEANEAFGHRLVFLSRSDSTLRSHFPLETDTILATARRCGEPELDARFLVPAFIEGGRVTAGDVHYVIDGKRRIPASDTEFARDSVFAYSTSNLPAYIEEKTKAAVKAADVRSVGLALLRDPRTDRLEGFLRGLSGGGWVVVNAETYGDLDVLAGAVLGAMAGGRRFGFQCAASVVRSLSGIGAKALLRGELSGGGAPGLFVVGSHVQKTTRQLDLLLECPGVEGIEIDAAAVLSDRRAEGRRVLAAARSALKTGQTPALYTSRRELDFPSRQQRLAAGQKISSFLAGCVARLDARLSYLVAKGGITSHDVLVDGLKVGMARAMGQVLPGVPVVSLPDGSAFPGMPYVIFPGNVGDERALVDLLEILSASQ